MANRNSIELNVTLHPRVELLDQKTNNRMSLVAAGRQGLASFDEELEWRDAHEARLGSLLLSAWRVFWKWWWLILTAVVLGILAGVVATLLTTPIYRGTATLQIDREAAKIVNVQGIQPSEEFQGAEFFQTQYGLLKSYSLAERVVRSLNLTEDPEFVSRRRSSSAGEPRSQAASANDRVAALESATAQVMGGLHVDPVRESKLVKVSFDSPDPKTAARIANAVTENFIQANLERRYEASSFARSFLESRLAQVRQKLEDSERELAVYATRQQIINVGGAGVKVDSTGGGYQSLTATDLDSMNRALAEAQQARILAEQHWAQAQATTGLGLPEIQQNQSITALLNQRATLTADYQNKLKVFKPEYSAMVQLRAQIDDANRQIDANSNSVKEALRAQYQITLHNENALSARVASLKAAFLDLQNRSIRYNIIQRDVDTSRSFYDGLLQREKEVAVAGVGSNNVSIVDPARVPHGPIRPSPALNVILSGGLGLLLGCALAFGLDQLDLSIKSPSDVETKLRIPLLGAIPFVKGNVEPLKAMTDPRSAISEAYISARTALLLSTPDSLPSSLLITSAQPSEGKSTTATALAGSLAAIGRQVLLIDADLRNPSLHKNFGMANLSGFSNILAGLSTLDAEVKRTGSSNLSIVSGGPVPPNPAELLTSSRLRTLLAEAASKFDVVILDGPPIMGLADAPLLADVAGGTILVVEAGQTGEQMAVTALKRIGAGGANVLGAVLTKFDLGTANGGDYGYQYNYGGEHVSPSGLKAISRNVGKLLRRS